MARKLLRANRQREHKRKTKGIEENSEGWKTEKEKGHKRNSEKETLKLSLSLSLFLPHTLSDVDTKNMDSGFMYNSEQKNICEQN